VASALGRPLSLAASGLTKWDPYEVKVIDTYDSLGLAIADSQGLRYPITDPMRAFSLEDLRHSSH
jgi:hypothetical protein